MSTLLELQRHMRMALLADSDAPPSSVIGGALTAASRVRIYRNNVFGNLTGALRLTFPAVERLVGAGFFTGAAAHFISATPPVSADLYEYGAAFPAFLAAFEPAQGIAYLPDVARLEWAVNQALHAANDPALTADTLLGIPEEQQPGLMFAAHPSLSLLALAHPAKTIWEAVMTEDMEARAFALAAIDIAAEGDVLAVLNGTDGLALLRLSPIAYDLALALTNGQALADALDLIPDEDAAPLLGGLIAHGFFGRCHLPEITNERQNRIKAMSTTASKPTPAESGIMPLASAIIGLFDRIPYWLIALTARIALAQVFWSSAQSHLANWDTTLFMFANTFNVPLLPPDTAAYLAVAMEVVMPPLLVLGLATRFASLALFGMTLVIEIFVFPEAWPTHIQWAAMMLVLMWRGAGMLSLDALIQRWFKRSA